MMAMLITKIMIVKYNDDDGRSGFDNNDDGSAVDN